MVSSSTVSIRLPSTLRAHFGGKSTVSVSVDGSTVRDALTALTMSCGGAIDFVDYVSQKFVNVYVRFEELEYLDGLDTTIEDGENIDIGIASAGG